MTPTRIEALQRDFGKLKVWAITSCIKFDKSKYWILHLQLLSSGYMYRWRDERLESSLVERDQWVLVGSKLNMNKQGVQRANHMLGCTRLSTATM